MTTKKKTLLLFLLTMLSPGHLMVRLNGKEWWPFYNYPTYSHLYELKQILFYEVWAIDESGFEEKLTISKHFFPFDERSLEEVFLFNKKTKRRQGIIQSSHKWYEARSTAQVWKTRKALRI